MAFRSFLSLFSSKSLLMNMASYMIVEICVPLLQSCVFVQSSSANIRAIACMPFSDISISNRSAHSLMLSILRRFPLDLPSSREYCAILACRSLAVSLTTRSSPSSKNGQRSVSARASARHHPSRRSPPPVIASTHHVSSQATSAQLSLCN